MNAMKTTAKERQERHNIVHKCREKLQEDHDERAECRDIVHDRRGSAKKSTRNAEAKAAMNAVVMNTNHATRTAM